MAYSRCASTIAKSFAVQCATPNIGGLTGRAVIFDARDITLTFDATNPRKITAVTIPTSKTPFAVVNDFQEPFAGTNKASNADGGRIQYAKTFGFKQPKRGADAAKDVEALASLPLGFVAILEKKNKVVDGGYEVVGAFQGLKVNADGVTQDETANAGDTSIVASCVEPYLECDYVGASGDTYADLLADFEAWLSASPEQ